MALSELEIKTAVYQFLRGSELAQAIDGRVYKDSLPSNSKAENIHIGVVASDTDQVQDFTVNINVYVPDVPRQNDLIENGPRLTELADKCIALLKSAAYGKFNFKLKKQRILAKEGAIPFHVISNTLSVQYCSA